MARSFAIDLGKLHSSQFVHRLFNSEKLFSDRVPGNFATHSTRLMCPDRHDKNGVVKLKFLSPCDGPQNSVRRLRNGARAVAKLKGNLSSGRRFLQRLKTKVRQFLQYLPIPARRSLCDRKLEQICRTVSRTVGLRADCDG